MKTIQQIRIVLIFFIICLILSGITAFPLVTEIDFLAKNSSVFPNILQDWIWHLHKQIHTTPSEILYGTDWLAFSHIIISLFLIPVYLYPKQYALNIVVCMFACVGVFFIAFICGPIRNIPFFHQLIDCAFGLFGFIPLYFIHKKIKTLP